MTFFQSNIWLWLICPSVSLLVGLVFFFLADDIAQPFDNIFPPFITLIFFILSLIVIYRATCWNRMPHPSIYALSPSSAYVLQCCVDTRDHIKLTRMRIWVPSQFHGLQASHVSNTNYMNITWFVPELSCANWFHLPLPSRTLHLSHSPLISPGCFAALLFPRCLFSFVVCSLLSWLELAKAPGSSLCHSCNSCLSSSFLSTFLCDLAVLLNLSLIWLCFLGSRTFLVSFVSRSSSCLLESLTELRGHHSAILETSVFPSSSFLSVSRLTVPLALSLLL